MPTISVDKAALFKALGQEYTTEEFDELCFEFGLELDEDVPDAAAYCALHLPDAKYLPRPNHFAQLPTGDSTKRRAPNTGRKGRMLRNIHFDKARYDSFIALQDKLHQNLARQRTLVSIGTHDLDMLQGPFSYEALPPKEINFVPLNQTQSMNGEQLMDFYEKDKHLGKYLHIIRDSPVYPVIYDSKRVVCSLPPIINGDHSKITLNTKNVFMEITATDKTKVEVVNNMMMAMFSQYTSEPFTIEPIKIISDHNGQTRLAPNITPRSTQASISYINQCCGLELSAQEICDLLKKMAYIARPSKSSTDLIDVEIPMTRADVLHEADIMEDVAIAYGFNELPRSFPSKSGTIAQPLPVNKLTDIIRTEAAMAGWSEVMPLILCSHDENFAWLNRKDDGNTAVKLANPKTVEFQVVRTSLLPGLLKTIRENKSHSVPIKIFEVSDVAFKDLSLERKSRNERHFAAAWYGRTSGFEVVHGLLDRVMAMLKSAFIVGEEGLDNPEVSGSRYWIEELEGHAASIHVCIGGKEHIIGTFGILHPTVLEKFELKYPVSTLEMNIEVFL
ncbi:phenylalanyl-tRNA synthetase, beta subunit [Uncinocarpus reesii 1704]|uniref:phenylalanine--tRNA ligase n=1 Tax=Uncinocarpus reesii (strain UAMH 1704) TaxID=336963 RepID=C4JK75_UNCRE|nr:phenylalanyl-tRNA synthetase, beta subunit [Uncinocarpus reesii 1704]EEP77183.1 phenylalanyl-tRNA synthetase, beta subunit [Uncinocarpus reesii 1704]